MALVDWRKHRIAEFSKDWTKNEPFEWRAVLACIIGGIILTPITTQLPALGYEWYVFFLNLKGSAAQYPPWTEAALYPFTVWSPRVGLGFLFGFLFMTVAVAAAHEARGQSRRSRLTAALLAILTPPLFMLLWRGNPTGLVLLGVLGLPYGVVYALLQPSIAVWAILARRRWILWAAGFGLLTLVIWGWWPGKMLGAVSELSSHPVAIGWESIGWPVALVGLVLLPFTDADPLHLMAAGTFLIPYLQPAHLLLLVPAIGRVTGWRRIALFLGAWLTALPPMFITPGAKLGAMMFPLMVWWFLRGQKIESQTQDIPAVAPTEKAVEVVA
jgi:hypothetical protein